MNDKGQDLSDALSIGSKNVDIHRDPRRESIGWLQMILIMLMFPVLFFLCVFFPIWIGLTPRFP